jgi:hypothetical protein
MKHAVRATQGASQMMEMHFSYQALRKGVAFQWSYIPDPAWRAIQPEHI